MTTTTTTTTTTTETSVTNVATKTRRNANYLPRENRLGSLGIAVSLTMVDSIAMAIYTRL
jgi:hypothetical protein